MCARKKGNILFNDALNTFYLLFYGMDRPFAANQKE